MKRGDMERSKRLQIGDKITCHNALLGEWEETVISIDHRGKAVTNKLRVFDRKGWARFEGKYEVYIAGSKGLGHNTYYI